MKDKESLKKHMDSEHEAEESLSKKTLIDERRYGKMEENKLQEMEAEKAKIMEDHKKMLEELTILRNEKRQNLVAEYKKLCSEKKVREKDVSNLSDDVVKLLSEQLKDIQMEKFKSQVAESIDLSGTEKTVFEQSQYVRGAAFWEMPDSNKIRANHKNRPTFPTKYGS